MWQINKIPKYLRLIRETADRGTTEPAEPSTEPKEMTVLLQLPIK